MGALSQKYLNHQPEHQCFNIKKKKKVINFYYFNKQVSVSNFKKSSFAMT